MGENGQEYTQNQPMTLKIQTTIKKSSPNGISQPSPFKDEFKCGAFHRHKKRTVKKIGTLKTTIYLQEMKGSNKIF